MSAATTAATTADVIVATLVSHGVDTVFGMPGIQTYPLFDALARSPIRIIGVRHEQAAAFMAFGYAQATGRPGVYTVVPGPGVLNSAAALVSAYGASVPVVCLTADIPSRFAGRGLGVLHELPDQLATLRGLTKWSAAIEHPSQAAELTARAFYHATQGRPRPVALQVPMDVLAAPAPVGPPIAPIPVLPPPIDPAAIARAAELLAAARQPMIMVGGGAKTAAPQVRDLARVLQCPVVAFRRGRGIVTDQDPYGFTAASGYQFWPDTDVLLGVGSRLELSWYRWPARPDPPRTVLIDIDPRQAARLRPEVAITADAAQALSALVSELSYTEAPRPDRSAEFTEAKERTAAEIRDIGPDLEYLAAIRAALPPDGFFVEESCQVGFASYIAYPVHTPREFITCGYQGTLGFGFPTALGVKSAMPQRSVVSVCGDGGFAFALPELATAVQHNLGVVTVVFSNDAFGNVLLDQQRLYQGRDVASRLHNPDFAAVATAFGADAHTARSPQELLAALTRALQAGRPAVIEVKTELGGTASPWKYMMPGSR